MFKCGICNEDSQPNEKAFHVVLETRQKTYPQRKAAYEFKSQAGGAVTRDDPGGQGFETVKEVLAHSSCATKYATV